MAQTKAGGLVTLSETLTGDVEFFTLFTSIDITAQTILQIIHKKILKV